MQLERSLSRGLGEDPPKWDLRVTVRISDGHVSISGYGLKVELGEGMQVVPVSDSDMRGLVSPDDVALAASRLSEATGAAFSDVFKVMMQARIGNKAALHDLLAKNHMKYLEDVNGRGEVISYLCRIK